MIFKMSDPNRNLINLDRVLSRRIIDTLDALYCGKYFHVCELFIRRIESDKLYLVMTLKFTREIFKEISIDITLCDNFDSIIDLLVSNEIKELSFLNISKIVSMFDDISYKDKYLTLLELVS